MAAIRVDNVFKQFGTQVVLEGVSLELHAGEIVGLVGANGSGKTTLFRVIAGELQPDRGVVIRARGLPIGHLKQEPEFDLDRTLLDEVGRAFEHLLTIEQKLLDIAEKISKAAGDVALAALMSRYERIHAQFDAAGGHGFQTRLAEVLGGLGFSQREHTQPLGELSGGQRCRAALAKLLLGGHGFLLLDEPTNHLDIDAVRWLERFLAGYKGGAVIVSHDRYLLDRLARRIIEIDGGRAASYPGNYSNFAETKSRLLLAQERQYEKDSAFIKKERAFIAKHLAGQRTKEAQGRRRRLERQLRAGEFVTEQTAKKRRARIEFTTISDRKGYVVRCDELAMAFGAKSVREKVDAVPSRDREGAVDAVDTAPLPYGRGSERTSRTRSKALFKDLTFQVHPGDRFGITGPNGTGKTTLLRILLGETAPVSGTCSVAAGVEVGYYRQEDFELDLDRTIVDEIRSVRTTLSEQDARSYLARFLFTGEDVFKTLGMLSGGEQSRVRLACLILRAPDLLILDEPTNHLDIPSCEALEEALREFGGTILLVSHDRYFLDRIVNRLLVIRTDRHAIYDGNYSFYLQESEAARSAPADKPAAAKKKVDKRSTKPSRKKSAPSRYDHLSIEELEAMVMEREVELAALHQRFGDPALYKEPDALVEVRERMDALAAELAEVDAVWQERVEGL